MKLFIKLELLQMKSLLKILMVLIFIIPDHMYKIIAGNL